MTTNTQAIKQIHERLDHMATKEALEEVKQDVGMLKQDVGMLKQDVGMLKQDVGMLKQDVGMLKQETSKIREEMATEFTQVRQEMATKEDLAQVRQEMVTKEENRKEHLELYRTLSGEIKEEIRKQRQEFGQEMVSHFGTMQEQMSEQFQIILEGQKQFVRRDELDALLKAYH